jgi:predicted transcriptional regulator
MSRKLVAIRVDLEQIKALNKMSRQEDRPMSWLIRKAIDEFLKLPKSRKQRMK